jgi:ATP-dependent RNA helicase DDX24/MAK5
MRTFLSPTPIQARAIPFALAGRDVVGVAETVSEGWHPFPCLTCYFQGSGKTLAYGLPILHHILSNHRPRLAKRRLRALILAPTRELALQVSSHLKDCVISSEENASAANVTKMPSEAIEPENDEQTAESSRNPRKPPLVSIAAVVGGMSSQKQRRILDRGADVLVATPGRLWDIIEDVRVLVGIFCICIMNICLRMMILQEKSGV